VFCGDENFFFSNFYVTELKLQCVPKNSDLNKLELLKKKKKLSLASSRITLYKKLIAVVALDIRN